MSLPSLIKNSFIGLCLLYSLGSFAQEKTKDLDIEQEETKSSIFGSKERQNLFAFSVGYHQPITTGDNFIGSALKGKSGYDLRLKMFVYKQFFVEYNYTSSEFDVTNKGLIGDYSNSSIASDFLYIGYEFLPFLDFKLGVNASLFGESKISNDGFTHSNGENQHDTGKLSSYGFYVAYEFNAYASIYVDYNYRVINTNINTPRELENFFSKGTFNTVGIGLMLTVGKKDAVSTILDYKL